MKGNETHQVQKGNSAYGRPSATGLVAGTANAPALLLDSIRQVVTSAESCLLCGHEDPDPDSLGSVYALAWWLDKQGVPVWTPPASVSEYLAFLEPDHLPNRRSWPPKEPVDVALVVDCVPARTGCAYSEVQRADRVVVIDHHLVGGLDGSSVSLWWIDPDAPATCVLVWRLLQHVGIRPDESCATALYAGIVGDTGGFRYSNTTPESLHIAARLIEAGASPHGVAEALFETKSRLYMEILGRVLSEMEFHAGGRAVIMKLGPDLQVPENEILDGLVNYGRMIARVQIAVLVRASSGQSKVSIRTREGVDAAEFAAELGGGGHRRAAGATTAVPFEQCLRRVRQLLDQFLAGK